MENKSCSVCQKNKPICEFSKSRTGRFGVRGDCKVCQRVKTKAHHHFKYHNDPSYKKKAIVLAAKWAAANPEKRAAIARRRNQKAKSQNPDKIRCRSLIALKVRFGRIPKASSLNCKECGNQAAHYHHHMGYEFRYRYDVIPVCAKCHAALG